MKSIGIIKLIKNSCLDTLTKWLYMAYLNCRELKIMENKYKNLIELIECFEKTNQYFWIDKLKVCDSIKGFLITYFKLI